MTRLQSSAVLKCALSRSSGYDTRSARQHSNHGGPRVCLHISGSVPQLPPVTVQLSFVTSTSTTGSNRRTPPRGFIPRRSSQGALFLWIPSGIRLHGVSKRLEAPPAVPLERVDRYPFFSKLLSKKGPRDEKQKILRYAHRQEAYGGTARVATGSLHGKSDGFSAPNLDQAAPHQAVLRQVPGGPQLSILRQSGVYFSCFTETSRTVPTPQKTRDSTVQLLMSTVVLPVAVQRQVLGMVQAVQRTAWKCSKSNALGIGVIAAAPLKKSLST